VCEGTESEGILVSIVAFEQELANEISAANVMGQVAKFRAAEWIITQVLDDGTTVGVSMCFLDLIIRKAWISL